jgi:protein-S-isoprenylcysteine O-methyltransferase Ste14
MAQKSFRQGLTRFFPQKYYGAFYAVASGLAVLVLVIFWQESPYTLISVQGLFRWVSRGIFILAIAGVGWTIWALGFFVNFRLQPMVDDLRGRHSSSALITDRGPYRWIRHPLYLCSLLMIWSNPDLTVDRLLFNLLFTIWVVIAILLEERRLLSAFGESYRTYQRSVPMLIPFLNNPYHLENKTSAESKATQ